MSEHSFTDVQALFHQCPSFVSPNKGHKNHSLNIGGSRLKPSIPCPEDSVLQTLLLLHEGVAAASNVIPLHLKVAFRN